MAHATNAALRVNRPQSQLTDLLAQPSSPTFPKVGDLVEGSIISTDGRQITVDLGGIASGVVRGGELWDESGEFSKIKIGDPVSATVIDLENEQGQIELSFRLAGHQKAWDRLKKLKSENVVMPARVKDANRGGLIVQVGNSVGFLPVSQLAPEHYPRVEGGDKQKILDTLKGFVGETLNVKVIDLNEIDQKLIVSERAAEVGRQKLVLSKYKVGDIVEGKVVGVVNFGAFVEFEEGVEGLVHISEIAWQRIDDPRNYLKVGDAVKARIIGIDEAKVSLSIKALAPDPWEGATANFTVNDLVMGTVEKTNPFGLFVALDQNIHGLVHISELSEKPVETIATFMETGKKYPFRVISLEPKAHRLGLSHKRVPQEVRDNPELMDSVNKREREERAAAALAAASAAPAEIVQTEPAPETTQKAPEPTPTV